MRAVSVDRAFTDLPSEVNEERSSYSFAGTQAIARVGSYAPEGCLLSARATMRRVAVEIRPSDDVVGTTILLTLHLKPRV